MLRKKGLITLLVIAGLIFGLTLILTDSFIESQIEDLGSSVVGAKVELDGVDLSLAGMHVSWERLQVTDPKNTMTNMVETGKCEIDLEFWPLLSKKVIIENIEVSGVITGTERETDGALPKKEKKAPEEKGFISKSIDRLGDEVSKTPALNLAGNVKNMNTDSVLALLKLESPGRIDSLKKDIEEKYAVWQNKLTDLEIEAEAKKLEAEIKALDVKKIKKLKQLKKALKSVKKIKKSVESLSKKVKGTKNDFSDDLKNTKKNLAQVEGWISADYARAMSLAKLPDINAQNIGRLLFGKNTVDQVNTYLGYAGTARTHAEKLKSDKPKDEKPPRLKGQDIYFYNKNARPDFWIKQIKLSGQTGDQIDLTGGVNNIVSDQRLINAVTDFAAAGSGPGGQKIALTGKLDYMEDEPKEDFKFNYSNFALRDIKLSDSELLPYKVEKGIGSIEAGLKMRADKIKGKITFFGTKLVFDQSTGGKSKTKLEQIIHETIKNTNNINFTAVISGEKDDLKFSITSNIDELIVKNLKASLSKEVDAAKRKVKKKVDEKIAKHKAELEKLAAGKEKMLKDELAKYENQIRDKTKMADDKKAEIDKEKKKLEKKLKGKVKNLL